MGKAKITNKNTGKLEPRKQFRPAQRLLGHRDWTAQLSNMRAQSNNHLAGPGSGHAWAGAGDPGALTEALVLVTGWALSSPRCGLSPWSPASPSCLP